MDRQELQNRQDRLKEYLGRISPGIYDTRSSGLEAMGTTDEEITGLESGLEKLASNKTLPPSDTFALEAIVHKKFRPAVFVIENSFSEPPDPWAHFGQSTLRQNIETALPSIGRIELPPETGIPFSGTGFVVGPGLIMTNRHVAEIFARGIGTLNLRFKTGMSAGFNSRREVIPTPDVKNLNVTRVEMIHPYWDMALLRVEGLPADQWLSLSTRDTEELIGSDIAVVGYPAQDPRNDIDLQNEIFGGVYDVKRMQPGKLDPRRKTISFGHTVEAVTHDASTLGGNSGSAVIDVASGQILALHFAGRYLDANFAVPTMEIARDQRVVDSGVNFNGSVATGAPWTQHWSIEDSLKEDNPLLAAIGSDGQSVVSDNTGTSPTSSLADGSKPTNSICPGGPDNAGSSDGHQVSITIPLTITLTVGEPGGITQAVVQQTDDAVANAGSLEGFYNRNRDEIIQNAYRRASSSQLQQSTFSASAALTTATASALVYSKNPASMEQTCRREFKFNSCKFMQKNSTECFVAVSSDTILVSFRGTQGIRDWIANLKLVEQETEFGMVHSGFLQAFLDIRNKVEKAIDAAVTDGRQLVITGHSLGGALATIAASEWRNRYQIRSVYTFGQPAVGDRAFRKSMEGITERFFRVVNDDDIVARIPPGYKHVGTRFKLPPNSQLESVGVEAPTVLESMPPVNMLSEAAFYQLQEQVDPALESAGLEGILPSFSDHKIANYLAKLLKLGNLA